MITIAIAVVMGSLFSYCHDYRISIVMIFHTIIGFREVMTLNKFRILGR